MSDGSSDIVEQFRADVINGLSAVEKHISSKYFYDEVGDKIFQRIMAAPEYYLTNAEAEILRDNAAEIVNLLSNGANEFDIIELGAGDGSKTKHLLLEALNQGLSPTYRPVDISNHILNELQQALQSEMPELRFSGIRAEYADVVNGSILDSTGSKCILFLGSNIGNLEIDQAIEMLRGMNSQMLQSDRLLIGFDLKKHPDVILAAYNDKGGATRDFNLNLLHRINRELNGNIDVGKFVHAPVYDPGKGRALSYLVATEDMEIMIDGHDNPMPLRAWEAIHLEISQKYDMHLIGHLAECAGLAIEQSFTDKRSQYVNVIFKKK